MYRLQTDLDQSVGVSTATQLVWSPIYGFNNTLCNSLAIKSTLKL